MNNVPLKLDEAVKSGVVMPSTAENVKAWMSAPLPQWAVLSIEELIERELWAELNNRFYRYLEFGTGGIRGRTIGEVTTEAELGTVLEKGTPEHAAVGANVLNDFTLVRATMGLFRYMKKYLDGQKRVEVPKIAIAHDVRHFSRHFCELAASTWVKLGGEAFIFEGPRSTPQLSFSVRYLKTHTGVVITASHNPSHDNGFKAYFEDGAQVTPPHDKGIVDEVNAVGLAEVMPFLAKDVSRVKLMGKKEDEAYQAVAMEAVIDAEVMKKMKLGVAFTNIHGTGAVASVPLLEKAGCEVHTVPEQLAFDPRFPTVKSPNPENAAALELAVKLADEKGLDLVLATDPDCDRIGSAVRGRDGKMHLLTGNAVGCLLADYRLTKFKELGVIPKERSDKVAVVSTYVTTRLGDAIVKAHGVKLIVTLTGFKWISAKIRGYEQKLVEALKKETGKDVDYDGIAFGERVKLLQKYSTFYAFGFEESYGYLANDNVRDKDGNSASLMFAELCAWVKGRGMTVLEYLDEIYRKHGFFCEDVINLYYEGASGAAKIKRILEGYRTNPPKGFGGVAVVKFDDFGRQEFKDADGEVIPKQDLYIVTLANGYSFAARGSGTEPKMKFYLFANEKVEVPEELETTKKKVREELARLKGLIEADAKARAEG